MSRYTSLIIAFAVMSFLLWACQSDKQPLAVKEIPEVLPMTQINLDDLSSFEPLTDNWRIVGNVISQFNQEMALESIEGNGVLLNLSPNDIASNLFFNFEHGDMEFEIDFLLPKGSNSGLYFQGRYEVQLFDSWNIENPAHSDCGGIYQRWDDTLVEGKKGYAGVPPVVNASKAPGLWQNVRASFRAPRFDSEGTKIENARFNHVYLNGKLIHENVEVTGPTRASADNNESPFGKFMIQGDHGPVAFRNIRYKTYDHTKTLELRNLSYKYYEDKWDTLPDFNVLTPIDSGASKGLEVSELSQRNEDYGFVFNGNLSVPTTGTYLFDVYFDNGGELFIDDKRVVGDVGKNGGGRDRNLIELTEGQHNFQVSHFQTVWGSTISINYEGPGISNQTLGIEVREEERSKPDPIIVEAKTDPEMTRGFILYKDSVKTHALSIGDPNGIHYTYDLSTGAPILGWKGVYADVSGMWHSRGQTQLLRPGNSTVELEEGPILGELKNDKWIPNDNYVFKKYVLDGDNRPVFHSNYGDVKIEDAIIPVKTDTPELHRTIVIENGTNTDVLLIAAGSDITKLANGYYNINGQYYIKPSPSLEAEIQIKTDVGLIVPISTNNEKIQYSVIW